MSRIGEPYEAADFEDICEDCGAPPGALCYTSCPSGYSAETQQRHRELLAQQQTAPHRCVAEEAE